MHEIRSTGDVREALESISQYIGYFKEIVDELKKLESPVAKTYDSSWIIKLAQAQTLMSLGAKPESFDPEKIKKAARDTNTILSVHPGKINGRLMGAVDVLDLPILKEAMENVSEQFGRFNLEQEKIKEFKDGITSLESLDSRLLVLTKPCVELMSKL
jgi:prefoldin subunit 5